MSRGAPLLLALLGQLALVAGCSPPAPVAPPSLSTTAAPRSASVASGAEPVLRVSLLARDGSAWSAWYGVTPEPVDIARRCLAETGDAAFLEGFVAFEVEFVSPLAVRVARSADLPAPLVACLHRGLAAASPSPSSSALEPSIVYFAIGNE